MGAMTAGGARGDRDGDVGGGAAGPYGSTTLTVNGFTSASGVMKASRRAAAVGV